MLFFILLKFILILGSSFSAGSYQIHIVSLQALQVYHNSSFEVERCDENEVRLVHCETISIPLPNPFQRCPSDQVWPAQNKSKLCFSSQNIARGLVFIDTSNDRKEIKSLTDGEEGTGEQVGKNTISIWELDLKQLVHVYAIVIQTDQGRPYLLRRFCHKIIINQCTSSSLSWTWTAFGGANRLPAEFQQIRRLRR